MERAGNEDYDDDTEKKGLGTPATRAATIESLEPKCREVCTEAEYEQIKKAFFEKEENLKALQAANIKDGI